MRIIAAILSGILDGLASGIAVGFGALAAIGEVSVPELAGWLVFASAAVVLSHRLLSLSRLIDCIEEQDL